MTLSNKLMYALLGLVVLSTIGMLFGSWRVVLYPFFPVAGICMVFGLMREVRSNRKMLLLPAGLVALLAALYVWLDAMSVADPDGEGLVLGFAPTTALYFFGITPAVILVGLAFALTFSEETIESDKDAETPGPSHSEDQERTEV
jgi:hypothetical protein